MTFNPQDYHPDWKSISRQIRDQADWRCEHCGVAHGAVGARDRFGVWHDEDAIEGMNSGVGFDLWPDGYPKLIRIVLTVHHRCVNDCRDKRCIDPCHLIALCQRDHLNADRPHHLAVQAANRERRKRAAVLATGQRELLS